MGKAMPAPIFGAFAESATPRELTGRLPNVALAGAAMPEVEPLCVINTGTISLKLFTRSPARFSRSH